MGWRNHGRGVWRCVMNELWPIDLPRFEAEGREGPDYRLPLRMQGAGSPRHRQTVVAWKWTLCDRAAWRRAVVMAALLAVVLGFVGEGDWWLGGLLALAAGMGVQLAKGAADVRRACGARTATPRRWWSEETSPN